MKITTYYRHFINFNYFYSEKNTYLQNYKFSIVIFQHRNLHRNINDWFYSTITGDRQLNTKSLLMWQKWNPRGKGTPLKWKIFLKNDILNWICGCESKKWLSIWKIFVFHPQTEKSGEIFGCICQWKEVINLENLRTPLSNRGFWEIFRCIGIPHACSFSSSTDLGVQLWKNKVKYNIL